MVRRGPLSDSSSHLFCLKHWCSTPSMSPPRLSKSFYSRFVPLKRTNNFGFVFFLDCFYRRIYVEFLDTRQLSSPPPFYSVITLTLQGSKCFWVTVPMLSLYQSPVNCRSRKAEGNVVHKVNYRTIIILQAWNLLS